MYYSDGYTLQASGKRQQCFSKLAVAGILSKLVEPRFAILAIVARRLISPIREDLRPGRREARGDRKTQSVQPFHSFKTFNCFAPFNTFKQILRPVPNVPIVPSLRYVQNVTDLRPFKSSRSDSARAGGVALSILDKLRFSVVTGLHGEACARWMFSSQLMADKKTWICQKRRWQKG
jgi:hypothetical protein